MIVCPSLTLVAALEEIFGARLIIAGCGHQDLSGLNPLDCLWEKEICAVDMNTPPSLQGQKYVFEEKLPVFRRRRSGVSGIFSVRARLA
jgi:hypothetical protein